MTKEKTELYRYTHRIEEKQVQAFKEAIHLNDSNSEIPPTYATVIDFQGGMSFEKLTDLLTFDPSCVLHGSQQYEYKKPIYIGDSIEAVVFLIGKTTKRGMTFAKLETEYKRDGETVIISRSTIIEQKGATHV
ncbi:hypothetical protein AWH48_13695 [Domibacillus aminovorans]|uniref:FAS1-like dehydratase domain-containing protein n=2 Tax=Bacillales TaxID=1385 RepID=A0A177KHJ8_9BACI|nr:hypothetical protein AWH48_13695 [Domibacillus aminovorans]